MSDKIMLFKDDNGFLSNFYPCHIVLDGTQYSSVEHAFQAAKAGMEDKFTHTDFSGKKTTLLTRECEERWEKEKSEKKTPTVIRYWQLREKQPTGQINMWED